MTPIITAALARKPRRNPRAIQRAGGEGEGKIRPHNYLAQPAKKQPGASLGNRHAARRSLEYVERQVRLAALIRHLSDTADAAMAMANRACAERACLCALLREPRA